MLFTQDIVASQGLTLGIVHSANLGPAHSNLGGLQQLAERGDQIARLVGTTLTTLIGNNHSPYSLPVS